MKQWLLTAVLVLFAAALMAENRNVTLMSHLDSYGSYNDCWGYTAPNGREYAILGLGTPGGISIVDITNPAAATEVVFVPGPDCLWRDMKTYQNFLYVANDCNGGMQIIDLSPLPDSVIVVGTYTGFSRSHNIFVDEPAGILYAVGGTSAPIRVLSLSNASSPVQLTTFGIESHDFFSRDSVFYVAEVTEGSIGIYDVSNPASPSLLQRVPVPSPGYVHNVWVSNDKHWMISTEETVGKTIKMWDISDLNQVTLVDEYIGENRFAHNAFFLGDFAYISHYGSGFKVVDIADPTNMVEVGSYDVYPGGQSPNLWGTYPYTGNGAQVMSDISSGLYIVQFNGTRAYRISGTLRDASSGNPIDNGWVEIVETGQIARSNAAGEFKFGFAGSGTITLRSVGFGFMVNERQMTAVPGNTDVITIDLQATPRSSLTGTVVNQAGQPEVGATVHLLVNSALFSQPLDMPTVTGLNGQYAFNDLPISDSIWVDYQQVLLDQFFPYPQSSVSGITVAAGTPTVVDFTVHPADLLLVNDDPAGDFQSAFNSALTEYGAVSFQWHTATDGEGIPASGMAQLTNPVVIWFTGNAQGNSLGTVAQDSLAAFLNNGGKLFLTGQNVVEDLSTQGAPFLADYLEVAYAGAPVGPPLINAVSTNPMSGSLAPFAANQPSRDILSPLSPGHAEEAFTYFGGGDAGVTVENPTRNTKIVLLGFGFEAITSATSRSALMAAALNWMDVTTDIQTPSGDQVPAAFELRQNYPNPFNPSTTIAYLLPTRAKVALNIYNLLGQEVRNLVKGDQAPGLQQVQWDGRDNHGNTVASGIYIYRIVAGDFTATRKMILLR